MPNAMAGMKARQAAMTRNTTWLARATQVMSPPNASTSNTRNSVPWGSSTTSPRGGPRPEISRRPCMAVEVGFEPTEGLPLHTLSRRAPSATRRLHRSRAYLSQEIRGCQPDGVLAAPVEELGQHRRALVGEHAADDLDRPAEAPIVQHVPNRPGGASPRISGAVHQPPDAAGQHGARAHRARLQGHH